MMTMTLEKELAALDEKALTHLTEEVVENTVSGRVKAGMIKDFCTRYSMDVDLVYSAIQRETTRRLRKNAWKVK